MQRVNLKEVRQEGRNEQETVLFEVRNDKTWITASLVVKNSPANAGDAGDVVSIPGSGRSPGEGNGNPLQHSCLGNPRDREDWQAAIHGVAKESDTT